MGAMSTYLSSWYLAEKQNGWLPITLLQKLHHQWGFTPPPNHQATHKPFLSLVLPGWAGLPQRGCANPSLDKGAQRAPYTH